MVLKSPTHGCCHTSQNEVTPARSAARGASEPEQQLCIACAFLLVPSAFTSTAFARSFWGSLAACVVGAAYRAQA